MRASSRGRRALGAGLLIAMAGTVLVGPNQVRIDRVTAGEILGLLERLNDGLGKTILMVTHDPKAAERAHRIVHLEKGVLAD